MKNEGKTTSVIEEETKKIPSITFLGSPSRRWACPRC